MPEGGDKRCCASDDLLQKIRRFFVACCELQGEFAALLSGHLSPNLATSLSILGQPMAGADAICLRSEDNSRAL
jgi:hypothetical protein